MTHRVTRRWAGAWGLLALGSMAGPLAAQNAVVRGTVTSVARQEALAGVNLVIPSLGLSAVPSDKGQYTITIPAARISTAPIAVTARAIGFRAMTKTQVIPAGETVLDFALETDISRLEEIVVTGVTEATERAKVAFSVGRITADDIPVPSVDPVRTLSGRVAGVRLSGSSGQPGATPELVMRGPTSINASGRGQRPLIIVDGVIMSVGNLNEIASTDIESVEVVKGAAGSTLYGARASQGVISIRTKRGGTGRPSSRP